MFDFLTRDNKQLRAQIFEFLKVGRAARCWGAGQACCRLLGC